MDGFSSKWQLPFEKEYKTDADSSIIVSINIHLRKTTDSQHGLLSSLLKISDDGRLVVKWRWNDRPTSMVTNR